MVLLKNGKIFTMVSKTIDSGYVIINGDKIAEVGEMAKLDKSRAFDSTIDLNGKLLLPGFIDAHTHLGMWEDGVGNEGEDINEMSDPATPHVMALDAIDPLDNCFKEGYRAGVTTSIISPGSANPIAGQIVAMKNYGRWVEDMIIENPVAMKFALGENPKSVYGENDQAPKSRMATAAIIREHLFKAKRYMQDIDEAIDKDDSPPEFDYKCESLIPVLKRELKAHFHAHRAYDIQTAIRIGKEFDLDYVIVHGTEGHRIADILAREECKVICGPLLGTRSKPELSNATLDNYSALIKAGVLAAISSDHPEVPVNFLPMSASVLINHGVSSYEALLGLTYNAAKIVGLESRIGAIAVGLDADLQVYSADPMEIHSKVERLFINGEEIDLT